MNERANDDTQSDQGSVENRLFQFRRTNSGNKRYATIGQLPNGKDINLYTLGNNAKLLDSEMRKLYSKNTLDRTSRPGRKKKATINFGYEAVFKTPEYHIINGKGPSEGDLTILPNDMEAPQKVHDNTKNSKIQLGRYSKRPSIIKKNGPNEKRFENLNLSPSNYSKHKKSGMTLRFDLQPGRS